MVTFIFSFTSLHAQTEICNNGTDDDGDGLIDCFDPDCGLDTTCDDFFFGNRVVCADEIEVTTFALRQQWGSGNATATSHATPIVGDLDGNGVPEVVVINNFSRQVTILNGSDGTTLFQATLPYIPENTPAIADVDGDGDGEILIPEDKGNDLTLFDHELNVVWTAQASQNRLGIPGFADFDEDGDVEIYYKNEVMDASNGNIIIAGDNDWLRGYAHGSLAIDIVEDTECTDCGGLELISGNEIWAINEATGTRTLIRDMDDDIHDNIDPALNYYGKRWSCISAADYNLDGNVDLLMSGALGTTTEDHNGHTTVFFWDVVNEDVVTYQDPANNHSKGTGRINIGDVDGDGQLNANFVMNQRLYSLDENFDAHWIKGIKEGTSGFTGCTLFDFNGDGIIENRLPQ